MKEKVQWDSDKCAIGCENNLIFWVLDHFKHVFIKISRTIGRRKKTILRRLALYIRYNFSWRIETDRKLRIVLWKKLKAYVSLKKKKIAQTR